MKVLLFDEGKMVTKVAGEMRTWTVAKVTVQWEPGCFNKNVFVVTFLNVVLIKFVFVHFFSRKLFICNLLYGI